MGWGWGLEHPNSLDEGYEGQHDAQLLVLVQPRLHVRVRATLRREEDQREDGEQERHVQRDAIT